MRKNIALLLVLLLFAVVTPVGAKNDNQPGGNGPSGGQGKSEEHKPDSNPGGGNQNGNSGPTTQNFNENSQKPSPKPQGNPGRGSLQKLNNASSSASPSAKPKKSGNPVAQSKEDCKKGGWLSFFGIFKNQGDCVSNVATKGKNGPSGGDHDASASASPIATGSAEPSASPSATPEGTESSSLVENFNAGIEDVVDELNGIIKKIRKLLGFVD